MIGKRIRYYRKRAGLTLEQLAEGICSISYLSKIENGEKSSEEIIKLLCKRLGITYEEHINPQTLSVEAEKKLMELYNYLNEPNLDKVIPLLKYIHQQLEKGSFPQYQMRYELLHAKWLIVQDNLIGAESELKRLSSFYDTMDNYSKYFYHVFKGCLFFHMSDSKNALVNYQRAEKWLSKLEMKEREKAELYYEIACTYEQYYHMNSCINYTNRALEIYNKEYHLKKISNCHLLLGIANRKSLNFNAAEYHFKQALKFTEVYDDQEKSSIIYYNLGLMHNEQGHTNDGIELIKKCLHIPSTHENHAYALFELGKVYLFNNQLSKAKKAANEGLLFARNHHLDSHILLFQALELKMEEEEAYYAFVHHQVIPYFKKKRRWDIVANFAEDLADIAYKDRKYKNASLYYRTANEARKNIK
ncbi:helix-turn-helix domain-containing protein [Terrilactibacillus sp. BCM23-1]|uniref:Helix-turn-helix domain-containing protein n=1 Tax=Terrilactibacillus tamarindi TaxID=2599694 RepID=A0A6N8CUU3_9BACI|nr:helix-turn-helix transcriptional regulator [Terrilactibacillus tamarindi]MTT33147.1 helix-turn-helix domain-containing protein [Terrilactibacillus tamarindi]